MVHLDIYLFNIKIELEIMYKDTILNKMATKKIKGSVNKKELWSIFDSEIQLKPVEDPLECIYNKSGGARENCDQCSANLAFSEDGFLTCTNKMCGIIYKDMVDHSAEWKYYGADDAQGSDPTRCGMPTNPLLKESSLGCKVLSCGGALSWEMRKIQRFTAWQAMPYKEKTRYDDFQTITALSQVAGIPKLIIDDAMKYHTKISEHETTYRGDNRDGIIAASIFIACKINNYPRTSKEIATIFHLDSTSATKGCKNAMVIINDIEKDLDNSEKTSLCRTKPKDFIDRYCSRLNISAELTKLCQFISIKIEKNGLIPENTPQSIAAGVVYFITQIFKLSILKKDVHLVSEISEVTINKCFKKIEKLKADLIPESIAKKYNI
jgi:transcription initiation factor TFIIB